MPYGLVGAYQHSGGMYCLHRQGGLNFTLKMIHYSEMLVTTYKTTSCELKFTLKMKVIHSSETLTPTRPHNITTQKTTINIFTAVRTSNLMHKEVVMDYVKVLSQTMTLGKI
jgi:hypothetical protein